MAALKVGNRIDSLLERAEWDKARALIKKEMVRDPDNHWLLTQLSETYYEQRRYHQALNQLLTSLDLVPDCPLTLWHLAGTLDALGDSEGALALYAWLLECKKTAADDPCWESAEWTDALKTDCVFRIGICFEHLGKKNKAAHFFRHYIDLLKVAASGSYSAEEAMRHIRNLGKVNHLAVRHELRKAANGLLHSTGASAPGNQPPKLNRKKLRQLQ